MTIHPAAAMTATNNTSPSAVERRLAMMLMGAFWGVYGADKTGSWVLGLLIAMLSGAVTAAVHAVFAIHLRADQIVREVGPVSTIIETDEHGLLNRHSVPNAKMLNEAVR